MAKKQTRRSISVSRGAYDRLRERCDALNLSMSGVMESQIASFLGLEPVAPTPKQGDRRPRKPVITTEARASILGEPEDIFVPTQPIQVVAPVVIEFSPKKAETPPAKKPGTALEEIASKIFTF